MERADKQLEDILPGDLDKALDDMDNKLNLTADEKDLGNQLPPFPPPSCPSFPLPLHPILLP